MSKEEILAEIRRTAEENGGTPLGQDRFERATGINRRDLWRYWARYSDAVLEAELTPNQLTPRRSDEQLVSAVAELIRELAKFPTEGEMRVRRHSDRSFPSSEVLRSHFGGKSGLAAAVLQFCTDKPEYADILDFCRVAATPRWSP